MSTKLEAFIKSQLKTLQKIQGEFDPSGIRPGDTVRVYQKIKEVLKKDKSSAGQAEKERVQVFEGMVIAKKHGKEAGATITVRKVISGVGVERILPIYSPTIEKIEVVKRGKARRAKLYYLRKAKGKKAKLRKIESVKKIQPGDEIEEKRETE